jgi:hypothetical protein
VLTSRGTVAPANTVMGGDGQKSGAFSPGVATRHRQGLYRDNGLPHPCQLVCIKPLPVNGYNFNASFFSEFHSG